MNNWAEATRGMLAAAGVFLGVLLGPLTVRADDAAGSSDAARAAYASAAALQNREAWDLAAEEWAELVKAHPRDPLAIKARYYLGVCQTKIGDWPAAAKTFREVAAATSDPATVTLARWELGRGGFLAAQQKPSPAAYEEAAARLREFLEKSPGQPQAADATFYLGESLWQAGKREAALEAWQRFVRDHAASPRMPEVLYALGVGQAELKRPAEAAATFKRFADTFPKHKLTDDVALWRAEVATATGGAAEADRLLVPRAAPTGPRATDALERLGAARWAQKNWAGAAEAYAALAAQRSDAGEAARAAATAGRAYVEAGAIDKARPLLEKASAAAGEVGIDAAHSLAALELDAKQPARALEVANRAIAAASAAKAPDTARLARLELDRADALWDLPGKKSEAAAAYAAIIKNRPQETGTVLAARAMTAVALLEEGKFPDALAAAESFLADKSSADAA
ncbi:MAG: tetratricopeptide repeat protein [Planctomycetia bacterium]